MYSRLVGVSGKRVLLGNGVLVKNRTLLKNGLLVGNRLLFMVIRERTVIKERIVSRVIHCCLVLGRS